MAKDISNIKLPRLGDSVGGTDVCHRHGAPVGGGHGGFGVEKVLPGEVENLVRESKAVLEEAKRLLANVEGGSSQVDLSAINAATTAANAAAASANAVANKILDAVDVLYDNNNVVSEDRDEDIEDVEESVISRALAAAESAENAASELEGDINEIVYGWIEDNKESIFGSRKLYVEELDGWSESLTPSEMRSFLQDAINSLSSNSTIVMPRMKTLLVDIPENDSSALLIPSYVTVDLNGSTLKCTENEFSKSNIVRIPYTSVHATLRNGTISGFRTENIETLATNIYAQEWNYAVKVEGAYSVLEDLKICNVNGDGVYLSGAMKYNHTSPIKGSNIVEGYVASDGTLASSEDYRVSPLLTISAYKCNFPSAAIGTELLIRPAIDNDTDAKRTAHVFENVRGYVVSYYTDGGVFLSQETIAETGVTMTIPEGAAKFRFHFYDPENYFEESQGYVNWNFWIMEVSVARNCIVQRCDIGMCGRNCMNNIVCDGSIIRQCYIHDAFGTDNQVLVDMEDVSYAVGEVLYENCTFDQRRFKEFVKYSPSGRTTCRGMIVTAGRNTRVMYCSFYGCGFSSRAYGDVVSNCSFYDGSVVSRVWSGSAPLRDWFAPTLVQNCKIDGSCVISYGTVDNCKIFGDLHNANIMSVSEPLYRVRYRNCEILNCGSLAPAEYEDCVISSSTSGIISMPKASTEKHEFRRCMINISSKWSFSQICNFHDCKINLELGSNRPFSPYFETIERCNISITNNSAYGNNRQMTYFVPTGNARFVGNYVTSDLTTAGACLHFNMSNANDLRLNDNEIVLDGASATIFYFGNGSDKSVYIHGNKVVGASARAKDWGTLSGSTPLSNIYRKNNDWGGITLNPTTENTNVYDIAGEGIFTSEPQCPKVGSLYLDPSTKTIKVCVTEKTSTTDAVWK